MISPLFSLAASNNKEPKVGREIMTNAGIFSLGLSGILAAALVLPLSSPAQSPSSNTGTATFTVTVVGKNDAAPPSVARDDVQLTINNERKQVASWTKANELYLAILIDDSLRSDAALQWDDLKSFIMAQPSTSHIALAYASNGTVFIAQNFTTDHALVAKTLRIPRGEIAAGSSPYLSVEDWIKRWPGTGTRRSLLLVSSGIDFFRGGFGPIYPDVDPTIELAEKGNINIWSIYYPSAGRVGHFFYLVDKAQLNLSKLSLETGGESYYLGFTAPVSFKPYLDELQMHLNNQYLLSFAGEGGAKGKFVSPRLKTELSGLDFMHANQTYISPSK
jgi:hypothetical protein